MEYNVRHKPKRWRKRLKKAKKKAGVLPSQQMVAVLTKSRGEIGDVIYMDKTPKENEWCSKRQENGIKVKNEKKAEVKRHGK